MKTIHFKDHPNFTPNKTPYEMFSEGIFGGAYFRPIYSSVINKHLSNQWKEFNFKLEDKKIHNLTFDKLVNKYGVLSGTSLEYWEEHNWINKQDPYGWVQWYCRFYQGRRSPDDDRQIKRWLSFAGQMGRFKRRLVNMINAKVKAELRKGNIKDAKTIKLKYLNDYTISPVIRQGLLQWAYEVTLEDLN